MYLNVRNDILRVRAGFCAPEMMMQQRIRSVAHPAISALFAAAAMVGLMSHASAQNLLTNGGFDGTNGVAGSAWSGCVNCWNGSNYTTTTQQVNGKLSTGATGPGIAGWSMTNTASNSNYTFVVTSAQASNTATNPGSFSNSTGFAGDSGNLSLWGTVAASPNGGNFVAMDGGYELQTLYQTVNQLTTGAWYTVSFSWAASQQRNFSGTVTDGWLVGFGTTVMAPTTTAANGSTIKATATKQVTQATSSWVQEQMSFMATASTIVLSFLAQGTPAGQPPFSLLDGVTLVPEPATSVMMLSGLAGLIGLRRAKRSRS